MERALVCHFYGWTDSEVGAMGFGTFAIYYKAALMLQAEEQMSAILAGSFHAFKEESRKRVMRNLKSAATKWLDKGPSDFKNVVKNLAMGLMNRG